MRYALMCGSYNPVHEGHLAVAEWTALNCPQIDKVLMSPSPRSPFKQSLPGATDAQRLEMLRLATKGLSDVEVTDIEMALPRPSYTIDTLEALSRTHKEDTFILLIGSDNWSEFRRWHRFQEIIDKYGVIVYPRPGYDLQTDSTLPPGVTFINAPMTDVSSTDIRQAVSNGIRPSHVPQPVWEYINKHQLYHICR